MVRASEAFLHVAVFLGLGWGSEGSALWVPWWLWGPGPTQGCAGGGEGAFLIPAQSLSPAQGA